MNKRSPLHLLLILAIMLAAVACSGGVDADSYGKIENGMTLEEVEGILGESDDKSGGGVDLGPVKASAATHTWKDGDKTITVTFMNGKVQGKVKSGF